MRLIVMGQQAFGKAALDRIVEEGRDQVVAVYCAPDKEGRPVDPIKEALIFIREVYLCDLAPENEFKLNETNLKCGIIRAADWTRPNPNGKSRIAHSRNTVGPFYACRPTLPEGEGIARCAHHVIFRGFSVCPASRCYRARFGSQ